MITSFFAPRKKRARPDDVNLPSKKRPSSSIGSSSSSSAASEATSSASSAASTSISVSSAALLDHFPTSTNPISWRTALKKTLDSEKFNELAEFVAGERASKTVYPPPELVFAALARTPLHKVKVVIVGQDPYHQPRQASGLSFSVPKSTSVPPSLRNIYKELLRDSSVPFDARPTHGNLERWADQGVLLLNSALTVRRGEAGSHAKRGWEEVTDAILRAVVERDDDANDETIEDATADGHETGAEGKRGKGTVFLLWGKPAQAKAQTVLDKHARNNHAVITCSHPSPLGATKTKTPFLGSGCFGRANEELVRRGWEAVDWRVDGDL